MTANLALLHTDAADGEVLNVGSTDRITIRGLAEHVIAETGADVESVYEDGKGADARHTHADVSKAQALLDYDVTRDIRSGVTAFVDWYADNEDWYEPLVLAS